MKKKTAVLTLCTLIALVSACGNKNNDATTHTPANENKTEENLDQAQSNDHEIDTTTGPSMVTDETTLETAVKDSWVVIINSDVTTDKELVFEGDLTRNDVVVPRLITLYNQDEDGVKTDSYTLTAPKATFKQDGSQIKGGTFKGDVYVDCNNFELVDATIDGNVYFSSQEALDSFKLDDTSTVTGTMELQ